MKWWHRWRLKRLQLKYPAQLARCSLLKESAKAFGDSYYDDAYREAVGRKIEMKSAIEYHKGKLK